VRRFEVETKGVEEICQDSIVKPVKEELLVFAGDIRNTYYIIGSFTNHENTKLATEKYPSLGFKISIISTANRNGIKAELVSVNTFSNFNEVVKYLREFQGRFVPNAWIYSNQ
jgi:hypothetical protein